MSQMAASQSRTLANSPWLTRVLTRRPLRRAVSSRACETGSPPFGSSVTQFFSSASRCQIVIRQSAALMFGSNFQKFSGPMLLLHPMVLKPAGQISANDWTLLPSLFRSGSEVGPSAVLRFEHCDCRCNNVQSNGLSVPVELDSRSFHC